MSKVEAVNEPVFTTPFGVIAIPLGLINITFPLEFKLPDMFDGVDPSTLFRENDFEEGCLKSTLPPE